MENKLERRYGLFTAICMVVGIVIGSGVFFKAQTILQKTEGNMPLGILAWIIGGMIMIFCILAFAAMAQKYEKVNGVVDYAEATVGPRYGYYLGWFMTIIYYPTLTVILAWLTARYTLVFLTSCWPNLPMLIPVAEGGCVIGPECMVLMMVYLVFAYVVNAETGGQVSGGDHGDQADPAGADGGGRHSGRPAGAESHAGEQLRHGFGDAGRDSITVAGLCLRNVVCL